jgi:hypothetical protein
VWQTAATQAGSSSQATDHDAAPSNKRKKTGKPRDSLINELLVPENPDDPSCKRQRCAFCTKSWAHRNPQRTRNHAVSECRNIPGTLQDRVKRELAQASHGELPRKVENEIKKELGETAAKQAHTTGTHARHCATCTCGMPSQPQHPDEDGDTDIHRFAYKMDVAIVMMMTVCGLPSRLLENPFFKNIFHLGTPHYKPPSANRFTEYLLPREAASVDMRTLDLLREESHLTSSFDGLTTPFGGESLYTHHATTPNGDSFLINAHHHSAESHTGSFLQELVKKDIDMVGASHFSAQCSDNTGNTRVCRELTAERYPWILNLADPSHHLHNTGKMIAEIPIVRLPI